MPLLRQAIHHYERIDEIPAIVVKKDGTAAFLARKAIGGLLKACEKRPVRVNARAVADRVEATLRNSLRKKYHRRRQLVRDGRLKNRQGGPRPLRVGLSAFRDIKSLPTSSSSC
jgi:hypothetical protein